MLIDYTQAFDSIKRSTVLECLIQYNIPAKLQKLIALTLTGTNAIVNKIMNLLINLTCKQGSNKETHYQLPSSALPWTQY
jgi:hypothetical protein